MSNHLRLYHKLKNQFLQWVPKERITRVRNLALLTTALYASKSVHLSKIANKLPVPGKVPSLTNRLWRLLDNKHIKVQDWYSPLLKKITTALGSTAQVFLLVDTSKVGFNHRVLTIGAAFKKRALPLAWKVEKGPKGHTSHDVQIALFQYVARFLTEITDIWVLGDSEFQSIPLLKWFGKQGWNFVVRLKGSVKIKRKGNDWVKISSLPLHEGETYYAGWVRVTEKHNAGWYWLILHWEKGEDEPWYLLSNREGRKRLIKYYRRRMWVEELFGDVKGHGFDLEATHLKNEERINRLILSVFIIFVWLISLGSWVVKRGYRHYVDVKSRRDKSYFRIGLDWIERCFRLDIPVPLRFSLYF
jgi:hypothetical protein